MSGLLHIQVVTPNRNVMNAEAAEITAPGIAGELTILPGHTTLLTQLGEGRLVVPGQPHCKVRGGFLEVVNDRVTILADAVLQLPTATSETDSH